MSLERRPSSIESNLRFLATVALALFAALLVALVLVETLLVGSEQTLEKVVEPVQQDIAQLHAAVAGMFRRQAQMSSTASSTQLESLRERGRLEQALRGAHQELHKHLAAAAGDPVARARAEQMATTIQSFLDADAELLATVAHYHSLHEDFARRLAEAQSGLRGLTEQGAAIAGVVRLDYVILLRQVARERSEASIREIVFGNARAQLQSVEELANAALELSAISGRIGLAPDTDALNSIAANEIAQNQQRIADRLGELAELTAGNDGLTARSEALGKRFRELTSAIGDEQRSDSLISVRRAVLTQQKHAAEVRETSAQRAGQLMADAAVLQDAANELASRSSTWAHRTENTSKVVVFLVVLFGIAATVLGARRVRASVADLRAQNKHLEQLSDELTHVNANLENQVAERTKALAQRERSLQLVLDSTGDGFLTVAPDGTVQHERSREAAAWFGAGKRGEPVWEMLGRDDRKIAVAVRMGFEQLVEDLLPFELTAEQMPRRILRDGRTLELAFRPVTEDGAMKRVLIIARDISERIEAERAEREAQELRDLVGSVLRDKPGFIDAVNDARALLGVIATAKDRKTMRRALHTLKGNAAMFGFHQLAARCHELEGELAETEDDVSPEQVVALKEQFDSTLAAIQEIFGEDFLSLVEVRDKDLDRLMRGLTERYEHASLLGFVASWRDESLDTVLRRFGSQAKRIAAALGKEIDVVVDDRGVRVPPGELRAFWGVMVHAVRNAVDHGIEMPDERAAAGKPRAGRLSFSARAVGTTLTLKIEDDGKGIDFDALRASAIRKGLPAATREDLVEAMFADGVSTKSEVSALSGRGVGMAALRQLCAELGGRIEVDTKAGAGTCLTFYLQLTRASTARLSITPGSLRPSGTSRAAS